LEETDRQRIDKWLWHARVVRTRGAAAALVGVGHVRLNGSRVAAASRPVRPGDVLTIALDRRVRVLKVTGYAERRGPAFAARNLFEELTPATRAEADRPSVGERPAGTGRPTKRERRALDRLLPAAGLEPE
jgi:ribosome-associated heat shock protein Hsp15